MPAATLTTLVDTAALADRLRDPAVTLIDCRYDLRNLEWGRREYLAGHIPGAVYASLSHDLAAAPSGRNGRHPLPDPDRLAATFGRLGIDASTQVVAYDQDTGMYASRLWWELRWLGHDAVAVLDGGFARWTSEGREIEAGEVRPRPRRFVPQVRTAMLVTAEDVDRARTRPDWRVIDARAPDRFRGENETIDKVAGHIPGAVNHFFQLNLNERGTFRTPGELRAAFDTIAGGVEPGHIVCYCGSGVTACQNLLALEHAGVQGARLYAGSWSEWSSDPAREVAGPDDRRG